MAYLSRICLKKLPGERWHFFRHKLKKSEEEGRVACKPQRTAEGGKKDGWVFWSQIFGSFFTSAKPVVRGVHRHTVASFHCTPCCTRLALWIPCIEAASVTPFTRYPGVISDGGKEPGIVRLSRSHSVCLSAPGVSSSALLLMPLVSRVGCLRHQALSVVPPGETQSGERSRNNLKTKEKKKTCRPSCFTCASVLFWHTAQDKLTGSLACVRGTP